MRKWQRFSFGKHDYSRVLFFVFLVSIFSIFFNKNYVYADTYSASLSGADSVNIDLAGTSGSSTASSTITANTTCPNGYIISINGINDNETSDFNLYLDGNDSETTNKFTTSSGTLSTPTLLGADTWGILVNNDLYSGVSSAPVAWFNVGVGDYTPGMNNTHTLTYGASHGGSLSAGTYSMANNGRIVYTLEMDNTCTSYTVAFNANEPTDAPAATGTMENQTITEGVATPLTANAYKVDGYTFVGWNTAADGSGTTYADKASATNLTAANTTITLYAQWALNIIQNYAGCPYLETGDTELLTDIRDGKTYWIAKFNDGHCWMTQNLDLDLETTSSQVATLTSENTDLIVYDESGYTEDLGYSQDSTTGVITWTPERATITPTDLSPSNWATSTDYTNPYSLDPGAYYYTDTYEATLASPGLNYLVDTNETYVSTTQYSGNGVHGHVGNYYTWSAAVASNDTSSYTSSTYANVGNNPQNSICPAGWRLPLTTSANPDYTNQGSLDEVKRLNYVVNNNSDITNSSAMLEASPLYMTRVGYVETGAITRAGRGSGIWTSTVNNTTDSKTLYFSGTKVYAPSDSDRNLGYPIRCVSKDESAVYHTITFQANEPAGAGTATGTMAQQEIPDATSANLHTNNFELAGYVFNGWNTSADGTGTAYANGASITPTTDIILYARWVRSYSLTYNFGNESFSGTNILNTDIALFGTDLVNKDFTLSFGIANATEVSGQSDDWNNVANAMSEAGSPYPGFVIRYKGANAANNQYRFVANASTSEKSDTGTLYNNSGGVTLERKSGLMYLNNITTPMLDFNQLASPFSTPLTFGAGLNGSNQPFRYSSNDLSSITLQITYSYNDTVTLPSPAMTNDTFLKWNTSADCTGTDYNAGSSLTITGATTLYPCWQSDVPVPTHTVTFLDNSPTGTTATGTMANQTVNEGVATALTANAYAVTGYTFLGWNTAADGLGTDYANGASVTLNSDLTLYAKWLDNSLITEHTLTFNYGNESFDSTNYINTDTRLFGSVLNSKDFELSFGIANSVYTTQSGNFNNIANSMDESNITTYPGFVVRYNSSQAGKQYNYNANATTASADKANKNVNITGGFKLQRIDGVAYLNNDTNTAFPDFNHLANTFETPLTFGAGLNGSGQPFRYATVDMSNIILKFTFKNTDAYTLPNPTKTNYLFIEWNTAADGSGTSYSAGDTITMSSDLTLYPIWQIDRETYEITFHANEPAGTATGSMPSQSLLDGIEGNLQANTFSLDNYIFLGWNTQADGNGTNYADGAPITITSDTDLYAKWIAEADVHTYTISYNIGDEAFDGTNYLNTGIKLFDDANIDRTFNIGFSIDSYTSDSSQDKQRNAIVTAQNEGDKNNYPGFVLRYITSAAANQRYSFAYYSVGNTKGKVETAEPTLPTNVSIGRVNRVLSYNGSTISGFDYTNISATFDRPLMFGASLNENGDGLYRYFTGSLSGIVVALNYTSLETVTVPTPIKPNHNFIEWNTLADGTGTSYAAGSTFTPSTDITLYPIWDPIVPVVNEYHEINLEKTRGTSTATIDLTGMDMGSSVQFKSSDTSVATVDSNGVVTAVNPGEATITVLGAKRAHYNVYVSESGIPLFNITPDPIQVYYNSRDAWDATKTKANFLANMQDTFEKYGCKVYNYRDNNGYLDSAVAYGWTDGANYCDQSKAYDTGQTSALNVYLYDTTSQQKTGNALSYTGATNGLIYNMIPGETYYWELADDPTTYGLVKATGKHRILNFTQGDYSRVSGQQITRNTREIGGLPVDTDYNGTIDGYTNYGRIFRAERLWTANGANADKFTNLGANFEIDVRSPGEGSSDSRLAGYRNDTVVQYAVKQGVDTSNYDTLRAVVTRAMQNVINGDNIYLHCSYGSDRTGTLAWVLEGLLGVTDEARLGDYELSTFYGAVDRNRYFEYEGSNTKRFTYMMTFLETGQNVYDWYMYGSIDKTADAALINNFRTAMITYESEG